MTAPTWTPCTIALGQLKPWAANPRLSTKAQAKRILASFAKFGQVQAVAIGPDNSVYDGHQRLSALLTVHGAEYEIDARRASRALTDEERRALVITLHAGATGAWNWDDLAGWDAPQLSAWGMDADALKQWNTDAAQLRTMLVSEESIDDAFAGLPTEDRAPFQQMTFTVHDDQAEVVKAAIARAKEQGVFVDTGNENSNGNALARICETYLSDHDNR